MKVKSALFAGVLVAGFVNTAQAQQDTAQASAEEYLAYLDRLAQQSRGQGNTTIQGTPSTVGIPGGFTLPHGAAFIAGAISNQRRDELTSSASDNVDASAALGFGLGDADNTIGMDVVLGIESVDPADFGDSGSLSLKVSRNVPSPFRGQSAAIALGAGNLGKYGDVAAADTNYYLATTTTYALPLDNVALPGVLSMGYGTAMGTRDDEEGLFIGNGLALSRWLSVGASWSVNEYVAGVTATTKWQDFDIQVGLSYGDVTHRNSDGRVMLSIALINMDLF